MPPFGSFRLFSSRDEDKEVSIGLRLVMLKAHGDFKIEHACQLRAELFFPFT